MRDAVFNTLVFLVPSKGSADTALDTMMDHVQSESLPFSKPYSEAFLGRGEPAPTPEARSPTAFLAGRAMTC